MLFQTTVKTTVNFCDVQRGAGLVTATLENMSFNSNTD